MYLWILHASEQKMQMEFFSYIEPLLGPWQLAYIPPMGWLGEGQQVHSRWNWSLELQSMLVLLQEVMNFTYIPWRIRLTSGPHLVASWAWLIFHILCYWDYAWNSPTNHPHSKLCSLSSLSAPLSPSLCILLPPPLHFSLLLPSHCLFPLVISSFLQVQLSPLPRYLPDVHFELQLYF